MSRSKIIDKFAERRVTGSLGASRSEAKSVMRRRRACANWRLALRPNLAIGRAPYSSFGSISFIFCKFPRIRVCRTREGFNKGMQGTPGASGLLRASGLLTQRMRAAGHRNEIDRSVGETIAEARYPTQADARALAFGTSSIQSPLFFASKSCSFRCQGRDTTAAESLFRPIVTVISCGNRPGCT